MNRKKILILVAIIGLIIGIMIFWFFANKVVVKFVDGDEVIKVVVTDRGDNIVLPYLEREGYIFDGWFNQEEKVDNHTFFTHNAVVSSKWHLKQTDMTITFDTNGGSPIETVTIKCDEEYTLPKPTREGYIFNGWLMDERYIVKDIKEIECGDVTLKARWKRPNELPEYETKDLDEVMDSLKLEKEHRNYKPNDDAINIYLFYGSGCPHCHDFLNFLSSIADEYGSYFKLSAFEVWNNTENSELMKEVSNELEESVSGVPYIIIGKNTFIGYSANSDNEIKRVIKE